ncbi:hypothetical protein ACJJTC_016676, partial [Scirpophaga incertulas]
MDEAPELVLRELCCTCLSRDRRLSQLCRLKDGINNLYLLLSYDTEAYREGFYKDTANWFICWECWTVMTRISKFQNQACRAQRLLADLVDGKTDLQLLNTCFSQLTHVHKTSIDIELFEQDYTDNFIDCGLNIKTESDDDVPLSELSINDYETHISEDNIPNNETQKENLSCKKTCENLKANVQNMNERDPIVDNYKKYYQTITMDDKEMVESRRERKLTTMYSKSPFKCEFCIVGFMIQVDFHNHNLALHTEKLKHMQCDVCKAFIKIPELANHRNSHYLKYECRHCQYMTYNVDTMIKHLRCKHSIKEVKMPLDRRKKGSRKTSRILKNGSKPKKSDTMSDKRTPFGYLCSECNKYFGNKNQRWKHIQKQHREGYKCSTCDKRFPFKNSLNRHETIHKALVDPPQRKECSVCHKMVRLDLVKIHARIHTDRDKFNCVECDKSFISRASYEHHLKYTQAHAVIDILKYKCTVCDKGYRSRGELRDHVNYQHMDKTQHKCPICGKALATPRCITRHVKRAHDGVKESAKDKICQQC